MSEEHSELRHLVNGWWDTQIRWHDKRGTDCDTREGVSDYKIQFKAEFEAARQDIWRLLDQCLAFQVRQVPAVYTTLQEQETFTWRIRWIHKIEVRT